MANCLKCRRGLKDPQSIQRGYGPVCWARIQEVTSEAMLDCRGNEYCGPYDGEDIVLKFLPNGTMWANVPHVIVRHSPTGYAWGYGGSGPADLALNILLAVTGNREIAERHYQQFKWDFIASMPEEGGIIRKQDILDWIEQKEAKYALPGLQWKGEETVCTA